MARPPARAMCRILHSTRRHSAGVAEDHWELRRMGEPSPDEATGDVHHEVHHESGRALELPLRTKRSLRAPPAMEPIRLCACRTATLPALQNHLPALWQQQLDMLGILQAGHRRFASTTIKRTP